MGSMRWTEYKRAWREEAQKEQENNHKKSEKPIFF